jgi:type VI secretion system secreted protein Hcp
METIFLKLSGSHQGAIQGSCKEQAHQNAIEVMSFSHSVSSPYDPTKSVSFAGSRSHGSLSIYKAIDKSSPLLMQALVTGEVMDKFNLELWWNNEKGEDQCYYTIDLGEARVVQIGINNHEESVSFAYKKITWTWKPDSKSTEDTVTNL